MTNYGQAITAIAEGGDGSGKTTAIEATASQLRADGLRVTVIADPGSTALGRLLRSVLAVDDKQTTEPPNASALSRMLIYAAARAQTEEEVLIPALQRSDVVILDRWVPSTIAYQAGLAGLDRQMVEQVIVATTGFLTADIAFYFRASAKTMVQRLKARGGKVPPMGDVQKIVDVYDYLVQSDMDAGGSAAWQGRRWVTLNADGAAKNVANDMTEAIYGLYRQKVGRR